MLKQRLEKSLGLLSLIGGLAFSGCETSEDYTSQQASTNQAVSSSNSRENNDEEGSPSYAQTGIIPQTGKYNFSARGQFSVASSNSINFSQDGYANYSISIQNGSFGFRNGLTFDSSRGSDSRNMYPTDGFDISGNFISETSAQGTISYSSQGRTYESTTFTATK